MGFQKFVIPIGLEKMADFLYTFARKFSKT